MGDLTATFQEFAKYVEVIQSEGRKPNDDDIDNFLESFLDDRRRQFFVSGVFIRTAYSLNEARQPVYNIQGKTYQDMVSEIRPALKQQVIDAYGSISEEYGPYEWMTQPMTVDDYAEYYAADMGKSEQYAKLSGTARLNHPAYEKAVKEVLRVKYRIKEYMRTVLPFIGRMTMYHPIAAVRFDTKNGPFSQIIRNKKDKTPFTLNGEEALQEWLSSKDIEGFPGAEHDALRSIYWEPSITGRNVKMGVIDLDNPAQLPHKEMTSIVKKVYRRIAFDLNHPAIIMYTGSSYQIWFGQSPDTLLETSREVNDYLLSTLSDLVTFKRDEAADLRMIYADPSVNQKRSLIRSFFSLHYPANKTTKKMQSGLAAVPVAFNDLDQFNPFKDAHPETVIANFDAYSSFVASFYDKVQIGQDYESEDDLETTPSCSRLDKRHPEASVLKALYKNQDLIQVEYRNMGAMLEDEEKVYAHPIARGVLGVLVYDPRGSSLLPGMTTQRVSSRNQVVLDKPKSYYILENGTVFYDDYICRDLERLCEAKKIRQAVLVGRFSKIDSFGNDETPDATRNALIRSEGILPEDARVLRFTINRASMVDGKAIPVEIMGEQIKQFSAKRIVPSAYFEFEKPVGAKLKRKFNDLLASRMMGSMMVEGEEKYLVKSTRTMMATVMALDITGRAYESRSMPPAIVGVAKPSGKWGAEYIMIGKAQIALKKEDSITLRTLVEGENKRKLIPPPRGDSAEGAVMYTEPSVVVEIAYDDVTPQQLITYTFAFTSDGKYRVISPSYATNRLINARIIAIHEDLDYRKPSNISAKQDSLISLSRKPTREASLIDAFNNPPKSNIPAFIRRNPAFHGVPEKFTTKVGGVPTESGVVGGRTVEIPLIKPGPFYMGERLPGELEAPYKRYARGEDGYRVFVDTNSLASKMTPPQYRITNLGWEYTTAVDDVFGMGQDGNKVKTMDGQISDIKSFNEVMGIYHLKGNKLQAIEDAKVLGYTARQTPGSLESEVPTRRGLDAQYREDYDKVTKQLRSSMGQTNTGKAEKDELTESILSNPPIKDSEWQKRVDMYVEAFNKWDGLPEPKEEWERYAIGMFSTWEVPMLEKERMMRKANEAYSLTDEEMARIDLEYAAPLADNMFDLILNDLYEVPEDDEEAEDEAA